MRKETEEVFDAVMLKDPSLKGLVEAVSSVPADTMFLVCEVLKREGRVKPGSESRAAGHKLVSVGCRK